MLDQCNCKGGVVFTLKIFAIATQKVEISNVAKICDMSDV